MAAAVRAARGLLLCWWAYLCGRAFAGAAPPQAIRSGSKIVHAAGPRDLAGSAKRCARLDCVLPLNPFCLTGPVRTRPSRNACVRRRL